MRVRIPSPLFSYTEQRSEVEAEGSTLLEVLADLDRRHPGIRFRMVDEQDRLRPHIRLFVGSRDVRDLGVRVAPEETLMIVAALSGG
jgi:molybdopterin synthase sulfur carrier subunit